MRGYLFLSGSIIFEVFATTMLKLSNQFTMVVPSICVVIGYVLSFYFLSLCLKTVPLSVAYGIWSGIGTVLTAIIGIVIWHDPMNLFTFLGFTLIIGGVFLLNTSEKESSIR